MENASQTNGDQRGQAHVDISLRTGYYVIGIPLGLFVLVGNIILLVVFKANHNKQQKAFRSKTTVILASLGIGDIISAAILVADAALYTVFGGNVDDYLHGCYTWNIVRLVLVLGTFLNLLMLAVERYAIVNRTPHHPRMKVCLACIICLWSYSVIAGFLAYAFIDPERGQVDRCDILIIPTLYVTVIISIHVIICVTACTVLMFLIKKIVKVHQRKIQVSNTITYNNMLEDARTAQLFYIVCVVSFLLWLPFLLCELLLLSGLETRGLVQASRWTFLLGHLACTKCFWYVLGRKSLRADFARTFKKPEKKPIRHGTSRGRVT